MHTGRGRRDGRLVVATLAWCAAVAIPAVPETHTPQMSSMGFVLSESSARGPHCSRQRGGRTLACRVLAVLPEAIKHGVTADSGVQQVAEYLQRHGFLGKLPHRWEGITG
eukprot:CAMPEP_0173112454 /NCGR_PEP_ID=MMETSP1102-20130122/46043_1 /TAXON_ID=49646 /ORGANISM="Geminigera sp., Strain Caron Lab Isolate" /LENGTH=109 /DNA_ID=CAMNT_0014013559 /DNA_START=146 /DNA_END=472 /DNA_ORIENTATION=+